MNDNLTDEKLNVENSVEEESFELETLIELEKKEIVAGLESVFRKSKRSFNIVKTVILGVAFFLFASSAIAEKNLLSFNSLVSVVILVIIFLLWFLPAFKFGRVAEEMISAGKNRLYLKIRGDLFIFGNDNTISINIREDYPVEYLKNLVFNKNGNIFVVPFRVLGDQLWERYTSI